MGNLIGQTLGPYRIIEQIGIGGMATVYKAYQPSMDRYVAIKVLPAVISRDPAFLKRFRREAKVVAKLEHKHILPVHDYGEQEGLTYLVMRYVEAGTLKDRLAAGQLDLPAIYRIIAQVGAALDYAHRLGVIHRDVKPTNVLIDSQGDAYLTDFGLARIMESSEQLTATGVGVGTPAYMAPEQGQGLKIDHRSDIYSLGVMLYEMVTGRVPYEAETPMAVVIKHITAPLPLPSSVKPDIPQQVERVVLKAMAKDPDDRFQTVGEMVTALDAAVRMVEAEAPSEVAVGELAVAKEAAPPSKGFLARAKAGVGEATQTGWGRTAMWAAVGVVALLAFFLALSRVPLKVQIRGGQLEVVRVVEVTITPEAPAPATTPKEAVAAKATATAESLPTTIPTPTLSASLPVAVASVKWEQIYDGEMFLRVGLNALAVAPNDPDMIFAGTYGAGIYVPRDGGRTWAPSNEGLGKGTVSRLVVDPNDSRVVYAALFDEGGVYKSTDGGRTWQVASTGIELDRGWDWIALITIDPSDSQRLYYAGATEGFYLSTDGGQSWTRQSVDCPQAMDFVVDPADFEHIYAANTQYSGPECLTGIYESTDGGQIWQLLTTAEMTIADEFGSDSWRVVADPRDFSTLYAGNSTSTYKSSDKGRTWTRIRGDSCDWLAINPGDGTVYCGQGGQVQISRDGGASWSSADLGGWGRWNSHPFAVAPDDPQTLYAGSDGVMKSSDGGETWLRIGWLGAARMRLAIDPRDGDRLFLGGRDSPCETYRSEDGGRTWQVIATDADGCSIAVHPAQNLLYRADRSRGLYRSTDNGQTWEQFGTGYRDSWQLVPDPQDGLKLWLMQGCGMRPLLSEDGGVTFAEVESFPQVVCGDPILMVHPDGKRIYVETNGVIYRSDDGGKVWRWLAELGGMYRAAALDPSDPDVVYFGSTHKGVLKTSDGGRTWYQMNMGLTASSINELAVDAGNPQTVYAATEGGAFVSVDGGQHWWPIQEGLGANPVVYSIAVDFNDPSKVYAATPDGIFRLVGAPLEGAAAPILTPMGRIVYSDGKTGNDEIYVANSDGSDEQRLTDHAAGDWDPAWSPDGTRIVFTSDREATHAEGYQLYLTNSDGSNPTRLTTRPDRNAKSASWSPDGSRIAFHSYCDLILIDADGSNWTTLVERREDLCPDFPTWAPDGRRIAFRNMTLPNSPPPVKHDIYVVNDDGSGLLKLATLTSEDWSRYVVWSPDGSQVAFDILVDGQERYYTVNSDGSGEPAEIPSIPDSWYPWYWPQWAGEEEAPPVAAAPTPTSTNIPTHTPSPTPTPTSAPTPTDTPVKVITSGDVYCQLSGPAGDLASRNPHTGFDVTVQSRNAVQVVVESPSGEIFVLPPHGDIYGWEQRFSTSFQGLPQAGGTYTFTALDADGTPIPGGVASDVYVGSYEADPPANVQAEVIEADILVTWDPSPIIPGAFDPNGSPPLGFYQIYLHREEGELLYGWSHENRPLPETSCLIPFRRQDFGPGDTGLALEEIDDGVYYVSLHAFSVAPEGTAGYYVECIADDPAENIRVIIEGGQMRIEGP